jgi:two-component system chemotaxis response regulator CheY
MRRTSIPASGFRQALVVDDSRAMRGLVGMTRESLGFGVVEAGDGVEALEQLALMRVPEVALVDWNMPRMNGLDLVRALRRRELYEHMAIVMVTSETTTDSVIEALAAGADEYLMKPFSAELLRDKLMLLEEEERVP